MSRVCPTGGLWRRRSKACTKERQKIVIVDGGVDLLADGHGQQNEASRKRRVQSTEGPVESYSPSLGRVSESSFLLEDLPIKTSSRIPILSDTHASDLGGAGRRFVLVGRGIRGAHEESWGNDARLRQCWGEWAHHCCVPGEFSRHCLRA